MSNKYKNTTMDKGKITRRWGRVILIVVIAVIGFLSLSKSPEPLSAGDTAKSACQTCGKAESCGSTKNLTP